jgi:hemerythrin-like metal-binding protein
MPQIEWDDSFSVNNTEIDDQHKKWIAIYNKMHVTLTKGARKALGDIAADSLKEMQDYARYHFDFEEEYMREIKYPGLVEHMRKHKDFDTQIYECNRDIREGKIVLNTEIIKLIKDWLLDHILNEDKKYSLFFDEEK